jgi:predicted nucleic acid-binding protein
VKFFVLDTCVLVEQFRSDRYRDRITALQGIVRTSAVVLAELGRGVKSLAERGLLHALEVNGEVLIPTEKHWSKSGQVLSKIQAERAFRPERLRGLDFDVLIALTARSFGATLTTSNRVDFELIREYRPFDLEVW